MGMGEMKLTYFNLMGRAETTRLILAQAGVAFEDKRIEPAEWPALKASLPMGQLPILEVVYQVITSLKRPRPTKPDILIEESDLTGCPALCALVAMVGGLPNIKKWEETRPATPY